MEQEISGAQDGLALPTLDKCKTLTKAQLKEANKAVEDASESEASKKRGKYNRYTEEDRANIGKYTAENWAYQSSLIFFCSSQV